MFVEGKIFFAVKNGKSKIHGKGTYAKEIIPRRKKIGSMSGELISKREARKKAKKEESIAVVELWNGKAIDASAQSNALRYINHSCDPNTYLRTFNYHVEFYALKNIYPGEELTCNYGPTHHDGKKLCRCGATNCKGYL
jgi:SET domain-containing protein